MTHIFRARALHFGLALTVALATVQVAALAPRSAHAQTSVTTQRYDNERSGCSVGETTLNTSNVNSKQFGKLFSRDVVGDVYAQPLIVAGLAMPKAGTRNVMFVATQANNVYAFDADDPKASKPLWQVNLGTPVPKADLGSACGTYNDFAGAVGITGTPVIDAASQTMYLVARTKNAEEALQAANVQPAVAAKTPSADGAAPDVELRDDGERAYDPAIAQSAGFHQYLHAIDIKTGRERAGSPIEIKATVPGNGAGSVGGKLEFNPRIHNQRAALALHDGIVYICWAGHCDTGPYHGWIMAYNAQTLKQTGAFCTTPNGSGAGIWLSGGGPTFDADGSMYLVAGNGTVDTDRKLAKPTEFGSSVMRFKTRAGRIEIADWFTPYNYTSLGDADLDTGSTSVVLIPGTDLIAAGSKAGVIYLLDKRHLGGFDPFVDRQIVQSLAASKGFLYSTPIIGTRAREATWLYSWGMDDQFKAFELRPGAFTSPVQAVSLSPQNKATLGTLDPQPVSISDGNIAAPRPGGMLTMSSNGGAPGSRIVWALVPSSDANNAVTAGVLRAFDARDLKRELWNSGPAFGRDGVGYFAKFCPPVVANGKVYVSSFSDQIHVYGLGAAPQTPAPQILTRSGTIKDFVTLDTDDLRVTIRYTLDGSLPTAQSERYRTPFLVDDAKQVKARAYKDGEIASEVASVIVTDPETKKSGSGLIGTYFASRDLSGPPTERIDASINDNRTPIGFAPFNWSARWTGQLKAPATGTYDLATLSDDGARLWLDGKLLIDDWNVHGATRNSAQVELTEGEVYPVVLEYFQGEFGATCQLMWTPPGQSESPIPTNALYAGYDMGTVGSGAGLTGRYYPAPDFKGNPVRRIDARINTDAAPNGIPRDNWSARWKGEVQATRSGDFTFSTLTDDGVRLWVDGQKLIDDWNVHGDKENSAIIRMEKGKKYPIVMEYFQGTNGATYRLMWAEPGQEKTLIPATQLYPDDSADPAPVLSVVGSGGGLTGFYFANTKLEGEPMVADEQEVGIESRPVEWPNLNWSVRWLGEIQATQTGTYTITTISDDGVRLWLNGKQRIDDWNVHGVKENSFKVDMVAGQKYPVRLEYFQGGFDAEVQLKWTNPLGVSMPVPRAQLYGSPDN